MIQFYAPDKNVYVRMQDDQYVLEKIVNFGEGVTIAFLNLGFG